MFARPDVYDPVSTKGLGLAVTVMGAELPPLPEPPPAPLWCRWRLGALISGPRVGSGASMV